jgi:adenosylcobinamide kinase/adenosylcobinamide-phosphate guanylyltransferase
MGKITFIIGGARSGKSTLAQKLAESQVQDVLYVATAQGLDEEMVDRIERHRSQRPSHWRTLEAPAHISQVLSGHLDGVGFVLLDCVTLLVSNLVLETCLDVEQPNESRAQVAVEHEFDTLVDFMRKGKPNWVVVSNEVGMGLVPPYPLGRVYRDLLGWFNQRLAAIADDVIWMVAGIPVPIGDFRKQKLE